MSNQRWTQIASDIMDLYAQLDRDVASFVKGSGMHCPPGCGACCLSPHVETTVAEMLPLALFLFERDEVDPVIERLQASGMTCAQYEALPGQPEKGRCRSYDHRPVLCRLFGYMGSRDKTGQPRYGACRVLHKLEAERIQKVEAQLKSGSLAIPCLTPAHERLVEIGGSWALEMMPINRALMRAIEIVGLSQQLDDHETGADLEPLCS
ncbi:MAG TPA: YkgJ family cysteine cluster protein [Oligoflexus sp.]|uniref:YkgJ family cysteine cluster protein n=1 Tax=Oligoflexus sp. TaxID=1971216 RepID=UPI002D7FB93D|nr:YkgJ family cysteine cluster protein [Oligoflexus sp.]HET9235901.1 YkgJ family cysteine cluster protein [Oligoflexus sp.]